MRKFLYIFLIGISWLLMWAASGPKESPKVFIGGEGPLYDSIWVRILLGQRACHTLWNIYQALEETRSFEKVIVYPTRRGDYQVRLVSRRPIFRIILPRRSLYVDSTGNLFPALRPVNVPLITMSRIDTEAVQTLTEAFKHYPFLRLLVSHIVQDARQVFWGYSQIGQEKFCLGRKEDLLQALPRMITFYRRWRPYMGFCSAIHLNLKNQVICQKN